MQGDLTCGEHFLDVTCHGHSIQFVMGRSFGIYQVEALVVLPKALALFSKKMPCKAFALD